MAGIFNSGGDNVELWQTLASLVSSIGFPIVCCGVLFYMNNNQQKAHKEEIDKLSETVNNNTLAVEKLLIVLNRGNDD